MYIKKTGRKSAGNWREKLLYTFLMQLLHQSLWLFI